MTPLPVETRVRTEPCPSLSERASGKPPPWRIGDTQSTAIAAVASFQDVFFSEVGRRFRPARTGRVGTGSLSETARESARQMIRPRLAGDIISVSGLLLACYACAPLCDTRALPGAPANGWCRRPAVDAPSTHRGSWRAGPASPS
jgi:hypothetical protein